MSPSQASSDDFPRLVRAENFDVWKTRDESDDDESNMSDIDNDTNAGPPEQPGNDSDAVNYDESGDELKPPSDSDDESGGDSDTSSKRKKLPVIRPFNRSQARQDRKRGTKEEPQPLHPRERRRQEAKTKAFLMKTMDNTHVRLVKNLTTSSEGHRTLAVRAASWMNGPRRRRGATGRQVGE
ncbi:unnamed protein product [Phytophthora fragariaefolia]|uniref:Unnamed protein product n=1 Tax=Phytophthora fragariaefolia TaxID=1490495 RepID=A0A9W7CMZ6_9STRA|nr:unnamed protein product [Phytophthora fragariaefolia]